MKEKFYITTPIYYPSGNPHIGHCYTTVACDCLARYKRARGYDVMFLTGTDEHGQKIEQKAKEQGITPQEYVDGIVANFKKLWDFIDVKYDRFVRTTDDYHIKTVQKVFKDLYDRGYIYKSEYVGKYCTPCESFWTESQLVDGKCPDCGREVVDSREEAYFFKLSAFSDRLRELLTTTDFLNPNSRVNEMVNNFIDAGLEDLCVSRTSFKWGIPVTFDDKHIVYVWVDALTNYISAMGYGNDTYHDYDKYWPADIHMMAKEIVRFHSLIWPAILMALDLPLPKKIYGHGWITFGDKKMSKSLGNVVDPFVLGERYGVDALRYHILREMPYSGDSNFNNEIMLNRINSDLANTYGNLVSRTFSMIQKYFGGTLPAQREAEAIDAELIGTVSEMVNVFEEKMDSIHIQDAITAILTALGRANKYIDETTPWILAKDEAKKTRLATVLYNLTESIRICTIALVPVMPRCTNIVLERMGLTEGDALRGWDTIHSFGALTPEVSVVVGDALFPRIDINKELDYLASLSAPAEEAAAEEAAPEEPEIDVPKKAEISIDDFDTMQFQIGEVLACEAVKKSKKLLCSQVKVGSRTLQIVSGIRKYYTPEEMVGKKVMVLTNLSPAKLAGVLSEGMILCASDAEGNLSLMVPEKDMPAGAEIS